MDEAPASILPPREPAAAGLLTAQETAEVDDELSFRDEALRVESGPPQVLDVGELAFHDESQRVASDPPQYLDVAELALHEESQRVASDPPRPLDVAALEFAEHAPGSEAEAGSEAEESPALASGPAIQLPKVEALAAAEVGPTPAAPGPLKLKVTPRVSQGSVSARPKGGSTAPAESQAIGAPLRARKLLAPREAGPRAEIDAELIPDEVHDEFAARRQSQDLSVAERNARMDQARQRSALVIGGVFAIGALLLSVGSGLGALLAFVFDVALGAGTGWYLGTKRPNRLVGAVTTWAAALALVFAHVAVALALYGPNSFAAFFLPLVFFQALAALSGMFLSTHLESLEVDQSI